MALKKFFGFGYQRDSGCIRKDKFLVRWGILEVETFAGVEKDEPFPYDVQAYAAGVVEGINFYINSSSLVNTMLQLIRVIT